MGIKASPKVKFEMIHTAIQNDNNVLNISELCRIAGVSRSGYYRWVETAPLRKSSEEKDKEDFKLIIEAYNARG